MVRWLGGLMSRAEGKSLEVSYVRTFLMRLP